MGIGYGYSNGLMTGMIMGNLMHPYNTVLYTGGGAYSGNALLYPDGQVVNQQGYQVGTYQNGQFIDTPNGGFVAQQAPQQEQPQPVVIEDNRLLGEVVAGALIILTLLVALALIA